MATTGLGPLDDLGTLQYNDVVFSVLYHSRLSGVAMPDAAERTTKYIEYTLNVEGVVTLEAGEDDTDVTWLAIWKRLSAPGAPLFYEGNGSGQLNVNVQGGDLWDVKWGPVPKVIDFQPLGGARAANIVWRVTTCVPRLLIARKLVPQPNPPGFKLPFQAGADVNLVNKPAVLPVVQFNYDSSLSYDDEGYATITLRGTLEIPMTRKSSLDRTLQATIDDFRQAYLDIHIDEENFRVVRRTFPSSRDKRTCEWEYIFEELPPMGLPIGSTSARGTMSIRPGFGGKGKFGFLTGIGWTVSLRCTYTVRKDYPRSWAWWSFLSLWVWRMWSVQEGEMPVIADPKNEPQQKPPDPAVEVGKNVLAGNFGAAAAGAAQAAANNLAKLWGVGFNTPNSGAVGGGVQGLSVLDQIKASGSAVVGEKGSVAIPIDFGVDEGLYLDSKTITFQASWWLATSWRSLFVASGMWTWMPGTLSGKQGEQYNAAMKDVLGYKNWLPTKLDPGADVIIDLGGGEPPFSP